MFFETAAGSPSHVLPLAAHVIGNERLYIDSLAQRANIVLPIKPVLHESTARIALLASCLPPDH